jgi:hypothetical protein
MNTSRAFRGRTLRISSEDKQFGQTNGNFSVQLGNTAFLQSVKTVVVKSISFKHVFNNIFSGNKTIDLVYNSIDYAVDIDEAWYDIESLAATLTTAINTVIPGIILVDVVSPAGTALQNRYIQFTTDSNSLTILSKANGNLMADVLGIKEDLVVAPASSERAQYRPDLGGLSVVYICSNILAGSHSAASSDNGEVIPILTEIPINASFGEEINYRSNDSELDTIVYQNSKNINSIDIQLCTRSGEILDLEQNNLTLMLKIVPMRNYGMS